MERFKFRLIGLLGKLLVNLLCCTLRIETVGFDRVAHLAESKKGILVFWHSRILLISYLFQGWGGVVMVSQSKDGEIMAQILKRQGQRPVRGSSSTGGLRALATLIRIIKREGRPCVVVPDGPRGPRFVVQPGVIMLARKTGFPIVPVAYSGRRIKVFSSWDRFILPYPFTTCRVVYGAPLTVPADCDKVQEALLQSRLQEDLRRVTNAADRRFNHYFPATDNETDQF